MEHTRVAYEVSNDHSFIHEPFSENVQVDSEGDGESKGESEGESESSE